MNSTIFDTWKQSFISLRDVINDVAVKFFGAG